MSRSSPMGRTHSSWVHSHPQAHPLNEGLGPSRSGSKWPPHPGQAAPKVQRPGPRSLTLASFPFPGRSPPRVSWETPPQHSPSPGRQGPGARPALGQPCLQARECFHSCRRGLPPAPCTQLACGSSSCCAHPGVTRSPQGVGGPGRRAPAGTEHPARVACPCSSDPLRAGGHGASLPWPPGSHDLPGQRGALLSVNGCLWRCSVSHGNNQC